jgi:hypothetical protein
MNVYETRNWLTLYQFLNLNYPTNLQNKALLFH